ncbi:FkbM family methyltransferase [bacterium]|nr:FkbM family methyltransferase [bacterium]
MNSIIRLLHVLKLYTPLKSIAELLTPLNPAYRHRRKAMKAFYAEFIHEDDICFDIGANIGNRSEVFLELGARVVAVEPQGACVEKLKRKFGNNPRITIVPAAVGEVEGEAELLVSNASTISSLSREWIDRVKESGRFSSYSWDRTEKVPITTFNRLIEKHGTPAFTKIDVEGYESSVMKGLSGPAGIISFEFTPEFITSALDSIDHLDSLGAVEFNYSTGETMCLAQSQWINAREMQSLLLSLPDKTIFGDVYARFG